MAEFFKTSTLWVLDYLFDGRARRAYRALRSEHDPTTLVAAELAELHGSRARLRSVRRATDDEESAYRRGETPVHHCCPVSRP
jgi:hypothetical protein